MRARARQAVGGEPLLLVPVVLAAAFYTAYAWLRHADLRSSLDLAVFDQVMWHYSRFETPASTLTGEPGFAGVPNILGDHFHPILTLLTPLYWIWADPRMLLAAQGVLLAAAAIPIFRYARPRVGRTAGLAIALGYLVSWTVLSAVGFDFHELAFAPLLIALAVLAADERRWRLYAVAIVGLLLTKEDLGILVAALGVLLLMQRRLKEAIATLVAGIGGYLLVTKVAIPHFAGGKPYPYWSYEAFGRDLPAAARSAIGAPLEPITTMVDEPRKLETYAALLVPVLGLLVASPLLLLGLPLLAERMLSSNENYWGTAFHYSLTLAPILYMGAADGLGRLVREDRRRAIAAAAILVLSLAGGVALSPVAELANADLYTRSERETAALEAFAQVPPNASVATQARFLPHLSGREEIRVLQPGVADTDVVLFDPAGRPFPSPDPGIVGRVVAEKRPRYRVAFSRSGVELLFRR